MATKTVSVKKKSIPTKAASKPASTKPADKDSKEIILTKTISNLSGTADLEFQLAKEAGNLYLRISNNQGKGMYSRNWISVKDLWDCLIAWPHGTITALALFPLWKHRSINTAGFIMAVLVTLKLLTPSQEKKRHYTLVTADQFLETVASLEQRQSHAYNRHAGCL
jgi:hypothetical protein